MTYVRERGARCDTASRSSRASLSASWPARGLTKLPVFEVLTKEPRAFFTAIGLKLCEISYALIAGVFAINYVTVEYLPCRAA